MSTKEDLASVLSEFARTLVTDFPIQSILDHLVQRIVDVLPVTGAGVTLISPGITPHYVAMSGAPALGFEQVQSHLGEGPCVSAVRSGVAVSVPDLAADRRFPAFATAALSVGMAAVFTFPMRQGAGPMGALDLYRDTAGPLSAEDLAAAQTLADVAAAYLLNAHARYKALEVSDQFRESALHDALTGLPNRLLLTQRLEHAGAEAQRSHSTVAVLFADLDRFKAVNDTHGHEVGDQLLIAVSRRLAALVRPGDTLARVSGDEFVFLCEHLSREGDVDVLAARIGGAFTAPFAVGGVQLPMSASVGIAYAGPGESVDSRLVSDADTAMYQAKRGRSGRQGLIDLRTEQVSHLDRLDKDLHSALANSELTMLYQPIVDTADDTITGVEALLRWTHPEEGAISALTTVGIAEKNGLIIEIGAWALEYACNDRARWLMQHPDRPLDLSVNVSAQQLMARGFADAVLAIMRATAMDPSALVLEITEGILIEDSSQAAAVLSELKALGVQLALDDFGTGYCSLAYLQQFPVDIVKIDQRFIASIGGTPTGSAIIEAVSNLAHVLGLRVTAEGVETEEQRRVVETIGCEHAQGFLYGMPVSAARIAASLSTRPLQPGSLPDRVH